METPPRRNPSGVVRRVAAVSIVATVHLVVWFSAFSTVFKAVDTGESLPVILELVLGLVLSVLGAPLMFLLYLPTSTLGTSTRWWGDDVNLLVALAVSNSFLWGCVVVWVYRLVRQRREAR